jgi:hypothetical protein
MSEPERKQLDAAYAAIKAALQRFDDADDSIVIRANLMALGTWCRGADRRAIAEALRAYIEDVAEFHALYDIQAIPPWQVVIRYDQTEAWRRYQTRERAAQDKTVQALRELIERAGQGRLEGI